MELDNNLNIKPRAVLVVEANGKRFYAHLEENSSAEDFKQKLSSQALVVQMKDFGSFEKVGELPFTLERNDGNIFTKVGDIVLYEGKNISINYDTNRWNLTKLGSINYKSKKELLDVLGIGEVNVKFFLEWDE